MPSLYHLLPCTQASAGLLILCSKERKQLLSPKAAPRESKCCQRQAFSKGNQRLKGRYGKLLLGSLLNKRFQGKRTSLRGGPAQKSLQCCILLHFEEPQELPQLCYFSRCSCRAWTCAHQVGTRDKFGLPAPSVLRGNSA